MKKLIAAFTTALLLPFNTFSQSADAFWSPMKESAVRASGPRQIVPQKYLTVQLNGSALKDKLFSAPSELQVKINESNCVVTLPLPNGTFQKFRVVESSIMEPELATKYPNIKTFSVKGIDDPYANGKLDWNEFGFHGMVRSVNGDFFIDPYCVSNTTDYISYYTEDFVKDPAQRIPEAGVLNSGNGNKGPAPQKKSIGGHGGANNRTESTICIGDQLRKYRLAVACTHQYAQAATGLSSPTKAQTLAKVITSVNRVDGVYETEVAIRLILIANDTLILFPSAATDPFTGNDNSDVLINESESVISQFIGNPNFDIGHTFSTGGGGLAFQGCVCSVNDKARGITGSSFPVGDPYDIDYVAHEMGHQFGGSHTFNAVSGSCGGGNRNGSTSMEPGSGVTIMAYAGICGSFDNLAPHSIPYFHAISYDEIVNYTHFSTGNACAVTVATGNQPPVVNAGMDYIIPVGTPFALSGSATDPDGDALTYSWEEIDPGVSGGLWNQGTAPFFRSYAPTADSVRNFPVNYTLTSGNFTVTKGEFLPQTAQILNFRLTARDNKMGGGGVCFDENLITVADDSGPFAVTYPTNTGLVWQSGTQETVTWNVNGTDIGSVGCGSVKISISYNSGNTFTTVLLAVTDNDGQETITVPAVPANIATCRIKVEAVDNVFFDISNNNFTISNSVGIKSVSQNNPVKLSVWPNPFNDQLHFAVSHLNNGTATDVTVLDLLGQAVLTNSYTSRSELEASLDLSEFRAGIYFLKVSNDNKQSVYKIVKN